MITPRSLQSPRFSAPARTTTQIILMAVAFATSFVWNQDYNLQAGMICLSTLTLAVAMAFADTQLQIKSLPIRLQMILGTMLGLFIWTWVRAFTSDVPATSMMAAGFYCTPLLAAFWVILQPTSQPLLRVVDMMLALMAGIALVGVGIAVWGDITGYYVHNSYRIDWPLQDANHYAMIMNAGVIAGFGLITQKNYRRVGALCIGVFLIGVMLAASRAGTFALIIGLLILLWPYRRYVRRAPQYLQWIILIALLIMGAMTIMRPTQGSTFYGMLYFLIDFGTTSGSRLQMWHQIADLATTHPIVGYGTATFLHIYPQTMTIKNTDAGFAAHFDWLQIWLEMGAIGAVLYAGIGLSILAYVWNTRQAKRIEPRTVLRATTLAILATLAIHAQIEFMLMVVPVLMVFGMSLGIFLRNEIAAVEPMGPRAVWPTWQSQGAALMVTFLSTLTLSQTYAQICAERGSNALNRGDLTAFVGSIKQASFYSMDLHAYPYLKTAQYRLSMLQSGVADRNVTVEGIQKALDQALNRNPYLSTAYEIQGRLDQFQSKSPVAAWQKGLAIEPRNADLRLGLLRYYQRTGARANLLALVKDSRGWPYLKGRSGELALFLKQYP